MPSRAAQLRGCLPAPTTTRGVCLCSAPAACVVVAFPADHKPPGDRGGSTPVPWPPAPRGYRPGSQLRGPNTCLEKGSPPPPPHTSPLCRSRIPVRRKGCAFVFLLSTLVEPYSLSALVLSTLQIPAPKRNTSKANANFSILLAIPFLPIFTSDGREVRMKLSRGSQPPGCRCVHAES